MKSKSIILSALLIPALAQAKLNVVATTPELAAIARDVAGDRADVISLAKPTEDTHFVDPKPSFVRKLASADLVVEGGAELEIGWLPPLLEGARNPKLAHLAIAPGIQLLGAPTTLDRSKGDVHALGNPHFMTDPLNGKIAAQRIAAELSRLDTAGAATYGENLAKFTARIDAKLVEWQKLLAPFAGKQIVAYHDTWPYFAQRFGLKIELFLEPKPGIPPTPASLAAVEKKMKTENLRVIIVEPYQNRKTAATVAAETGATVVPVTQYPGGVKGTEAGYVELIDYLVNALAKELAK
ncbi:MAG: metal ABC transporter substrate-binding protein [Verrucomicrobiota bacterium]